MPRRSVLTPIERASLLEIPVLEDELIRNYTLSEPDISVIKQHRGGHNRLGFAIQLCYLRFPGCALPIDTQPSLCEFGELMDEITDVRLFKRRHPKPILELTDRGMMLATAMLDMLRQQHIIIPTFDVIERVCSEALTRGTRHVSSKCSRRVSAR